MRWEKTGDADENAQASAGYVLSSPPPSPPRGAPDGPEQCFPYWQDLLSCYILNTTGDSAADARWRCSPQKGDYVECLHRGKEVCSPLALLLLLAPPWMLNATGLRLR